MIKYPKKSVLIAVIAIFGIVWLGTGLYVAKQRRIEAEETAIRTRNSVWVSEQKSLLTSGGKSSVYFYSTSQTDEMVAKFAGMREIEKLGFELTDLTRTGFPNVANLPNLRELMLYGGRHPIDSQTFEALRGHASLEKLELINTHVSDHGLELLKTLPKLVELELYRDSFREQFLTDAAIVYLRDLRELRKLTIAGGWMSETTIDELSKELPHCAIGTVSSH
jgi:hypothetical protein